MSDYWRGDIVLVNLEPTIGGEQQGKARPCLVVSSDIANSRFPIVVICPLTSKVKQHFNVGPVIVPAQTGGLDSESAVLVMQIRTIDKSRISTKIGKLPESIMARVSDSLRMALDLD
jgi:mRNA interferase MazF